MNLGRLRALAKAVAAPAAGDGPLFRHAGMGRSGRCQGLLSARMTGAGDEPPLELGGRLILVIGPNGSISQGKLVDETLGGIPVIGQVHGRDVGLLLMFPDGCIVSAEGVAEYDAGECRGSMFGVAAAWLADGSQSYHLGSWNVTQIAPN